MPIGRDLGPLFAAFADSLLKAAKRDGIRRLAFIARDGDFLRKVTAAWITRLGIPDPPSLEYVYLSRISTSLPQYERFGERVLSEASVALAATMDVSAFLGYYGLAAATYAADLQRHGLGLQDELRDVRVLRPLLADDVFLSKVNREAEQKRALLGDYLRQQNLLDDPQCALVDLGWRGSIPIAISRTFNRPLRAYHLAYWNESGDVPPPSVRIDGLLGDSQLRRDLHSAAPYYGAFILESVCRAPHGIVRGYIRNADGSIAPMLDEHGERVPEEIRADVLEFLAHCDPHSDLRAEARRRMFRLAFFPTSEQIEEVEELRHTEGFAKGWSRPLIAADRVSPLRSPRRWLAGLTSPWRAGYVRATGGPVLAWMFLALESVLIRLPRLRPWLRNTALRLARK